MTNENRTRVLIVDDHRLLLELLADSISQLKEFEVVGQCASGGEAIVTASTTSCDVVMLDLIMPALDGFECVRALRRINPHVRILIVSGSQDPVLVSRALNLGVRGYIEKSSSIEEIITALRVVSGGLTAFGRSIQPIVRKLLSSPFPLDAADRLSLREREVLAGIAAGRTSKAIAAQLGLSEFTIKNHRRRIKTKTGMQTTAELVLHAARIGIHVPAAGLNPATSS